MRVCPRVRLPPMRATPIRNARLFSTMYSYKGSNIWSSGLHKNHATDSYLQEEIKASCLQNKCDWAASLALYSWSKHEHIISVTKLQQWFRLGIVSSANDVDSIVQPYRAGALPCQAWLGRHDFLFHCTIQIVSLISHTINVIGCIRITVLISIGWCKVWWQLLILLPGPAWVPEADLAFLEDFTLVLARLAGAAWMCKLKRSLLMCGDLPRVVLFIVQWPYLTWSHCPFSVPAIFKI